MEKVITIGALSIPVKSTAGSLFSYKRNFGRDMMKDLVVLAKSLPQKQDATEQDWITAVLSDSFDLDVFYRLLWVFAKAANPNLPPLEAWLDALDVEPIRFLSEAIPQVEDMIYRNVQTTVSVKNG